jgi:hypothetical protein
MKDRENPDNPLIISEEALADVSAKTPERDRIRDIRVNINTPGLLVHGTKIERLKRIFAEGIRPPFEVGGRSYVPGHVSLSMVIGTYGQSSAEFLYGAGDKNVSLIIDPEYVDAHANQFEPVGRSFQPGNKNFDTRTKHIAILQKMEVKRLDDDLFWDEVLSPALPADSLIGIICEDPAMLDNIKAQLPERSIIIYDAKGDILYESDKA